MGARPRLPRTRPDRYGAFRDVHRPAGHDEPQPSTAARGPLVVRAGRWRVSLLVSGGSDACLENRWCGTQPVPGGSNPSPSALVIMALTWVFADLMITLIGVGVSVRVAVPMTAGAAPRVDGSGLLPAVLSPCVVAVTRRSVSVAGKARGRTPVFNGEGKGYLRLGSDSPAAGVKGRAFPRGAARGRQWCWLLLAYGQFADTGLRLACHAPAVT